MDLLLDGRAPWFKKINGVEKMSRVPSLSPGHLGSSKEELFLWKSVMTETVW